MAEAVLDREARVCYTGAMPRTAVSARTCTCGCGETPKGETAEFMPGHDARYKSHLIREVRAGGNDEAHAELERRGWLHFLEKAINNKRNTVNGRPKSEARKQADEDGLPMRADRFTWPDEIDWDKEAVSVRINRRKIAVRREVKGVPLNEEVFVRSVRLVVEGEVDLWDENGNCRTFRLTDIVAALP